MKRRAGLGVRHDASCIELHGARGQRGNFRFAVKTHDYREPARFSSRKEFASQVMPGGSRPVAGSSKSSTEGR